ncbi:MAG: phage portal protein [Alphaproteobacteria bacterium]|nr:phage portal protein [Alphaproteobacteria bacterium]
MFNWLRWPPPAETKAARALVAWHQPGRPVWSGRDLAAYAREGYAKNAVAHRCVRLIAEGAASAPLKVTPHDHPLAALLARPNAEQTGAELLEAFFGHLQVAGNAYLEASAFDEGPPDELFVLRPDRMAVIPGASGWPIGWEYRVGADTRRYMRDALTEDAPILHLKTFHPLDAWQGEPPLGGAVEDWRVDVRDGGGALLRTLTAGTTAAFYAAADQIADFGALPDAIAVTITQISARFGSGRGRDSLLRL